MGLENTYASLPEQFFAAASPAGMPAPTLLAFNRPLAEELGLELPHDEAELAGIFSGNQPLSGSAPIAMAYAGHQFGQFVPLLGDGRAILLGETRRADGRVFDVQLKGAGRTPFSRGGDGKSALGPVIREFILCEAMHALGVPTTRALAAVQSGEQVWRDGALPGGVFTRVAASHLRVGTCEYFAARRDLDGMRALAEFAMKRHYPAAAEAQYPYRALFRGVLAAQAELVARWMAIGFIHGVMNTDNFTLSGETLDYGPCAFMDEFRRDKVFSSIDRGGRYAYENQPPIALWNLTRLAECLVPLDDDREAWIAELDRYEALYDAHYLDLMRRKLGLTQAQDEDKQLVDDWLDLLAAEGRDYTLSFHDLAARATASDTQVFGEFELRWRRRLAAEPDNNGVAIEARMRAVNPRYIPRNHQVERAITSAVEDGDFSPFRTLHEVTRSPFELHPDDEVFAAAPAPTERVHKTFCGT